MADFLAQRRYQRPDQPQPVYLQIVDATVRTWSPAFAAELASFRTADGARLDVRRYDWAPTFDWVFPVVDAVTAQRAGVWSAEVGGRTPDGPKLDVRQFEWRPEDGWIFVSLPPSVTVAQMVPALLAALQSFRTADGPRLDVRQFDWTMGAGWIAPVVDALVGRWMPGIEANVGGRTPDGPKLDVRLLEWQPEDGWVFVSLPPTVTVAQMVPALLAALQSFRMADGPRLDVRQFDWTPQMGWLFSVPPPVVGGTTVRLAIDLGNGLFLVFGG